MLLNSPLIIVVYSAGMSCIHIAVFLSLASISGMLLSSQTELGGFAHPPLVTIILLLFLHIAVLSSVFHEIRIMHCLSSRKIYYLAYVFRVHIL